MKKVWVFSSENDKNVSVGIQRKKWAYKQSANSHGDITIGDYILLYSKESKNVMCVGTIRSLPRIGEPSNAWKDEVHWDWFTFIIKSTKRISLTAIKDKLGIEGNMGHYCKLLLPNAPSSLSARDAITISKMK